MNWLDALRYFVVLEAAFVVGMSLATLELYRKGGLVTSPITKPFVLLAVSYNVLVLIAAWSEWSRIGSDQLGWYAPFKFMALTLSALSLIQLFRIERRQHVG